MIAARARARRKRRWAITGVIAVSLAMLSGSISWVGLSPGSAAGTDTRLRVATTTNFLTDTVRRVGGPQVRVTGLMRPGVDPHLYKAAAGDVDRLRTADMVIAVGLYLEGKMQHVLDRVAEDRPVIQVGEKIPKHELLDPTDSAVPGEEYDPHVWFDVRLWKFAVRAIGEGLAARDPAHADAYRHRTSAYLDRLDRLDAELRTRLDRIPEPRRVLVTSHDAFRYFGRAYGFEVLGIQGISTSDEATTADISRVARVVTERHIPAVFVESSVSKQTLHAVLAAAGARGHHLRIGGKLFSDSAGAAGTPEGTYTGMLRANADRLVAGLT